MYFAFCPQIPKLSPMGIKNQKLKSCKNHAEINFPRSHKLFLQKIFLKIKLRKYLQKCLTPEKMVIITPACDNANTDSNYPYSKPTK